MPGSSLVDMLTDEELGEVDDLHSFPIQLGPYEGRAFLVEPPEEAAD